MARERDEHVPDEEEWDDGLDDPEAPQECDLVDQDSDETDTVPCPRCGREIPDDADRCPYCTDWVVQGGDTSHRSVMYLVVAVLALLCFVWWLL